MNWPTIRAILMLTGAGWCSISLFRDSVKKTSKMLWYDRVIRFIGGLIMAGLAIGGGYMLESGQLFLK
jgi:hypothetical protein